MNLALLSALLFLQTPPAEPACQVGQVIVDLAQHCCWPGQTWSDSIASCTGAIVCPSGMVASESMCMPAPATVTPPAPVALPPSPVFATVPVRFAAANPGDSYEVEVVTAGSPVCKTPCELRLVPARHKVRVSGTAKFGQRLDVLYAPMDLRIESRDELWKDLGIASIAVGGATFLAGVGYSYLYLMLNSMVAPREPDWARRRNETLLKAGGVAVLGAAIGVVGGVAGLRKAGHNRIAPSSAPKAAQTLPGIEHLAVGMAPADGGGQMGAAFTF